MHHPAMAFSEFRETPSSHAEARPSASVRSYRRMRARRTLLGYVAVWTAVAALALIAQAIAPAAT